MVVLLDAYLLLLLRGDRSPSIEEYSPRSKTIAHRRGRLAEHTLCIGHNRAKTCYPLRSSTEPTTTSEIAGNSHPDEVPERHVPFGRRVYYLREF